MTERVGIYRDKRNKRHPWVVRWYGEYDPATGKERRYTKSFATKREAEDFQAEQRAAFNDGRQKRDRPRDITVRELADRFLSKKVSRRRPSTRAMYRRTFDQLCAFVGESTPIRRIDTETADTFIATRGNLRCSEQALSEWSRNQYITNCRTAFKVAIEWGYIPRNPFASVEPERKLQGKDWHHLTPTEFEDLLTEAPDNRWRAFYLLAYTAGLRFGELFNLTWADIDFDRGRVHVRPRKASAKIPPFHVKDKEARTLLLPRRTIDVLTAWQAEAPEGVPLVLLTADRWAVVESRWDECREEEAAEWQNRNIMNNVLREVRRHVKRAGIETRYLMTVHTFRKSFGQNHADAGTPIHVLQKLMGHASIATTRQFYVQHTDANDRDALRRYEAVMSAAVGKTDVKVTYDAENGPCHQEQDAVNSCQDSTQGP